MRRSVISAAAVAVCAASLAGCSSSASSPAGSPADGGSGTAVTITYEGSAQFEIETPGGVVIYLDVWDPSALTTTPTANDILLSTHTHPDNWSPAFEPVFPGRKITCEAGTLEADGISIFGIPSAHRLGWAVAPKGGSNYIFVIDVAGMRIAHFGDLGQDALTDEQLAALGEVDVALAQLANGFSDMDEINRKGLNLMNQVKPKLFIPTKSSNATVELAIREWTSAWTTGPITISKDELPTETLFLPMGALAKAYGGLFGIPPYES